MKRRIKRYQKEYPYSYTLGVYPTLELLSRKPNEVEEVFFLTEGLENEGVQKLQALCKEKGIPHGCNSKVIQTLSPKENCYALGVFRKYQEPMEAQVPHIILVHPSNTGNVGTIIRTLLGFGFLDLALIRPAVDLFCPPVLRSSMGSAFAIRFAYYESFEEYQALYPRKLYTFCLDGSTKLGEIAPVDTPYGLVFGNESSGLPTDVARRGEGVVIPHQREIDSLNLAVSVGIACYHFRFANRKE